MQVRGKGDEMKKQLTVITAAVVIVAFIVAFLIYNGYIWFNNPSIKEFPVRGIDVSNHQGAINWEALKGEALKFVYIKATEGSDYKDKYFNDNWVNAKKVGLKRGAYHFYTFGSSGLDQASNFINTVPNDRGDLPPVIDVEFGGNSKSVPEKEPFQKELKVFIQQITDAYKQEPILYVTYEAYEKYIQGDFKEYKIWIRDIFKYPKLQGKRVWVIWQYNNRGRVDGITGFVDLNVFRGSEKDFESLILDK